MLLLSCQLFDTGASVAVRLCFFTAAAFCLQMSSVRPVFIKNRDIPLSDSDVPKVLEICTAAEKSCGQGLIVGAQSIRGLWRVYPATPEARADLLIKGICIRNTSLRPSDTNPYVLRDDTGEEKPSTKLWIDEIPISVADAEIKHALSSLGCELRSAVMMDRARNADGKMTRFLTGRRFVFITVPKTPLVKSVKISVFTAKLFHWEQKMNKSPPVCSVCLQTGHHRSVCTNDVVCRTCKQPGHRGGDPSCPLDQSQSEPLRKSKDPNHEEQSNATNQKTNQENKTSQEVPRQEKEKKSSPSGTPGKTTSKDSSPTPPRNNEKDSPKPSANSSDSRSRTFSRQLTMKHAFESGKFRSRSATPKRRRSGDPKSPSAVSGKLARHDDGARDDSECLDSQITESDDQTKDVWG